MRGSRSGSQHAALQILGSAISGLVRIYWLFYYDLRRRLYGVLARLLRRPHVPVLLHHDWCFSGAVRRGEVLEEDEVAKARGDGFVEGC